MAASHADDGEEGAPTEYADGPTPSSWVGQRKASASSDEPMEKLEGEIPTVHAAFEPKAPERSPAPAVFKAWRQDKYSTMMMQAVLQDDADALIWMLRHNLIDLSATDDLGNTAAHLAVFHDSPRVLRLLHELGLDLAATCDAAEFGSAIFYSVMLGRVECLEELIGLGYDMSRPCDRFERTPETVAIRHDQGAALSLVLRSLACLDIQRLTRGFHGRQKAKRIRAAWARGAKTDPAGETSVVDVDGVVAEDGKGVDDAGGELGGSLAGEGGEDEGASADDAGNEGIAV